MQRELIHQLGKEDRKTLLDEADTAYIATQVSRNRK